MIELKISAGNATELNTQIAALAAALGTATALSPEQDIKVGAAVEKARGRGAAEPAPEPKVEKLPEEKAVEPAPAAEENTDQAATYADVQAAVTKLAASKGRDAVISVFDTFGVDHGSKLTEAQWPEAITALTDALEG